MTLEAAIQLIKELGVTVSVLAYFIYRDYKFMSKLDSTLDIIQTFITKEEKRRDSYWQVMESQKYPVL